MMDKSNKDDPTAEELLEMQSNLRDELHHLELAHSALNQDSDVEAHDSMEKLQERMIELSQQLLEESTIASRTELFIKRIQLRKALMDTLFSDEVSSEKEAIIKRSLEELELTSHIMRIQEEIAGLQKTCDELKFSNTGLMYENTALMQKLKTSNDEIQKVPSDIAKSKEYKKLKSELEVKCRSVDIWKQLTQQLILATGTDWYLNPQLRKAMLECGEPLSL